MFIVSTEQRNTTCVEFIWLVNFRYKIKTAENLMKFVFTSYLLSSVIYFISGARQEKVGEEDDIFRASLPISADFHSTWLNFIRVHRHNLQCLHIFKTTLSVSGVKVLLTNVVSNSVTPMK